MQPRQPLDTDVDARRNGTARMRAEPGRPGRVRVRPLAARGLAAVLLAAFAALLVLPLQAQAQTIVPTLFASGTDLINLGQDRIYD